MFFAHKFKSVMTRDVNSYREQNALQVVGVEKLYSTTVQKMFLRVHYCCTIRQQQTKDWGSQLRFGFYQR